MSRRSKVQMVADHLVELGRITDGGALIQYGRFRLSDAIYRLRRERRDLLPPGKRIITVERTDRMGNLFAEYRLVDASLADA